MIYVRIGTFLGLKGSMVKRDCAIVGKSWLMDMDLFFLYDGKFPQEDVWNTEIET